jgi:hypothetical protein
MLSTNQQTIISILVGEGIPFDRAYDIAINMKKGLSVDQMLRESDYWPNKKKPRTSRRVSVGEYKLQFLRDSLLTEFCELRRTSMSWEDFILSEVRRLELST